MRTCMECGGEFPPPTRGAGKLFCSKRCKQNHENRRTTRGKVIAPLAMAWRQNRGSGTTAKAAFAEMCRILDRFAAEDREAGRPRQDAYVEASMATNHTRLMDR